MRDLTIDSAYLLFEDPDFPPAQEVEDVVLSISRLQLIKKRVFITYNLLWQMGYKVWAVKLL